MIDGQSLLRRLHFCLFFGLAFSDILLLSRALHLQPVKMVQDCLQSAYVAESNFICNCLKKYVALYMRMLKSPLIFAVIV